jgi:hypothetical protein
MTASPQIPTQSPFTFTNVERQLTGIDVFARRVRRPGSAKDSMAREPGLDSYWRFNGHRFLDLLPTGEYADCERLPRRRSPAPRTLTATRSDSRRSRLAASETPTPTVIFDRMGGGDDYLVGPTTAPRGPATIRIDITVRGRSSCRPQSCAPTRRSTTTRGGSRTTRSAVAST